MTTKPVTHAQLLDLLSRTEAAKSNLEDAVRTQTINTGYWRQRYEKLAASEPHAELAEVKAKLAKIECHVECFLDAAEEAISSLRSDLKRIG